MKSSHIAATGLAAALVAFSGSLVSSGGSVIAQQKEIAFESAGDFLTMPADIHLGEVAGVATTSNGNLWVYNQGGGLNLTVGAARLHPAGGARLFEFDRSGKFLREFGGTNEERPYGFRWAQGVRVDSEGNVWTVDRGSRTIIKFAPDGRILMILGRTPEAIGEVGSSAGGGGGRGAGEGRGGAARGSARSSARGSARGSARRWRWWWRPRWRPRSARRRYARRQFQPADRYRLGRSGQHLRFRRVHQRAGRQVRQDRAVRQVVGTDRLGTRSVQYSELHCGGCPG